MPVFAYRAIASGNRADAGVIVADTPRSARDALRARGLTVESLSEEATSARPTSRGFRPAGAAGVSQRQVTGFIRELATLLGVGMPLAEALQLIATDHGATPLATVALRIRAAITSGRTLSSALAAQPAMFDALAVSLVDVGEHSGTLELALTRLAEFRERSAGLRNRVVTALIYPAVVLTMSIIVSVLLMTVVVPNLLSALADAGRPLPLPTRVVKAFSDVLVSWWWLIALALAAALAMVRFILATHAGRLRCHTWLLRMPLLGDLLRKQAVVRLAIVMSTLLKAGVVFTRALEIGAATTDNLALRAALQRAGADVAEGRDISASLARTRAFSAVVVQVFSVGQQSGRLEEMLDRLAADYDAQVAQATQRLTALLEPVLILCLVGIVGLIGFATIMPMLEAADAL